MTDNILTMSQAATISGVPIPTLYAYAKSGVLKTQRIASVITTDTASLQEVSSAHAAAKRLRVRA
ncbi:hypothetical protein [Acetobacter tropicalis]|uniref:Helix-turn-helix domain-containing protein n=1 Tax=Acetobacter tropicalis TaxID=104102 RepID=A0A252A3N7_9PROT|nr:hypothetical protein [Acetobacter tropicalis]OUI83379.1 hypothetical protein HC62_14580 [Acetobacter tropicalis]